MKTVIVTSIKEAIEAIEELGEGDTLILDKKIAEVDRNTITDKAHLKGINIKNKTSHDFFLDFFHPIVKEHFDDFFTWWNQFDSSSQKTIYKLVSASNLINVRKYNKELTVKEQVDLFVNEFKIRLNLSYNPLQKAICNRKLNDCIFNLFQDEKKSIDV